MILPVRGKIPWVGCWESGDEVDRVCRANSNRVDCIQERGMMTPLDRDRKKCCAQAYTEYVVILAVLFALGFGVTSVFVGFDTIRGALFDYYSSLANFLNLPCF